MQKRLLLSISSIILCAVVVALVWRFAVSSTASSSSRLLYITKTLSNEYHRQIVNGIKAEAQGRYGKVTVFAPEHESDYKYQVEALQDILRNGQEYDGLVIAPNHSSALLSQLRALGSAGLRYVVVDTKLDVGIQALPGYCGFVGTDNRYGGALAADFIGNSIQSGEVLLIRGIMNHETSRAREAGFMRHISKFPNIHIAGMLEGKWHAQTAFGVYAEFRRNSSVKVDAVFAYNDPMILALEHNGGDRPMLVGFNGDVEAQSAILAGQIDATIVQTPALMGRLAVQRLSDCHHDDSVQDVATPVSLMKSTQVLTTIDSLAQ